MSTQRINPLREPWTPDNAKRALDQIFQLVNKLEERIATLENTATLARDDIKKNVSLHGGTTNYGLGDKVLFAENTTTAPSSNPVGGGYWYIDGGALKYRGSSGTTTTIAPA